MEHDVRFITILCKCARKTCGHVFTEEEMEKIPSMEIDGMMNHVCPKCGNRSYYYLDHTGLRSSAIRYAEATLDIRDITPSNRLGVSMRKSLEEAKIRFIENIMNKREEQDIIDGKEDFVLMPKRLTAENGAKALLMGEFKEKIEVDCPFCVGTGLDEEDEEECEYCGGRGSGPIDIVISWTNIKKIYAMAVKHFAGIDYDE